MYPKLINDYYVSEDYYGENVLHMAIVNEDPATVKFLLDNGVNYHERCCGAFMSPEDQKGSRTDSLTQEWVNVDPNTNYEGYVYWGEYPLSFAACLGQEECYRLILAKGADPNKQDTNGNTVLHMLVIHNKMEMFDIAYELGADMNIKNVLQLTPLTLAAKLAHTEMFDHIVKIQREIYWQLGGVVCAAYKLPQIDTIHPKHGGIQKNSVLNLVVFGDKEAHLDLMEGVLVDLLHAKWNTFVKARFYKQFITFGVYFLISLLCFTIRPAPPLNNYSTVTPPVRNLTGNRTGTRPLNRTDSPVSILPPTFASDAVSNFSTGSGEIFGDTVAYSLPDQLEEREKLITSFVTPLISTTLGRKDEFSSEQGNLTVAPSLVAELGNVAVALIVPLESTVAPSPGGASRNTIIEDGDIDISSNSETLELVTESAETILKVENEVREKKHTDQSVPNTTEPSDSSLPSALSSLDGDGDGSDERIKREKQDVKPLKDETESDLLRGSSTSYLDLVNMHEGSGSSLERDPGLSLRISATFEELDASTPRMRGGGPEESEKAIDQVVMEVEIKGDRVSLIAPRRGKRALIGSRGNRYRHFTPQAKSTNVHLTREAEDMSLENEERKGEMEDEFAVDNFVADENGEQFAEFKYRKKKPGGFGKPGKEEPEPGSQPDDYVYEYFDSVENDTSIPDPNSTDVEGVTTIATSPRTRTVTPPLLTTTPAPVKKKRFNDTDACRLWKLTSPVDYIRVGAEILVVVGAVLYLLGAANEGWYLGRKMFVENLMTAPSRVLFLMSCWMVLAMIPLRFLCIPRAEDNVAVLVMLSTGPYFLFFCRGFKKVGPFVVMIYRMIMGDLLRFVTIYAVFIMGFSQAYYIVFLSFDNQDANPMPNAAESVMAMFLMSMNDFDSMFEAFVKTDHEVVAKCLFVIFMAIVAVLLVNLLIAMMGNTYTKISECANEWQRQWARIVLVVERGVPPSERLKQQIAYSQPTVSGHRALVLRIPQTEEDREEIEDIRELNLNHQKYLERKRKKIGSTSTISAK